ncbi:hypothetical protein DVA67_002815 [Solirubrobacter sp. CPCC 204708]|uniref:Uncharacterized protein n=1 Tax=Solirubrobacter deserti TaxID=2282478 RepID=A0ABT4RRH1_9ACTN|nr:hypothetical protein [Solirubrobacter deserti]MBE2314894.1 hypothetical protein [Solirubrobacter deserti]MDA0141121.1 hypothetical protein [Solirubrobacter deserti]
MSELDAYLERFGAQVRGAKPPRRRGQLAAGTLLVVAVAVLGAVLALGPGGGTQPVDAVAAARRALDPRGVILHMRIRTDAPPGVSGIQQAYQETWTAQAPERWRLKQWWVGGPAQEQAAYAGGELSWLRAGTLTVRQGYKDDTPQSRLPNMLTQGAEPDTDLRGMLASGAVQDRGEVQSGGRTVRRLVRTSRHVDTVIDVDPATFAPVGGSTTTKFGNRGPAMTSTFVVEAFERLPITPQNEARLRIVVPEGTKRVVHSSADVRRFEREYREWRKRCRERKDGRSACPGTPPRLDG